MPTLTFMLNEIRAINCSSAKDFYKSLCKIMEERRIVYSAKLNFLKNPNKESDFDKDFDTTLIKFELKALILLYAMVRKKILSHSTWIVASQMRRTLLSVLKSYLVTSKNTKAL